MARTTGNGYTQQAILQGGPTFRRVMRVDASEFVGGRDYVVLCSGVVGAFESTVINGLPAQAKLQLTNANGSFVSDSFSPVTETDQSLSDFRRAGNPTQSVGNPFFLLVKVTQPATPVHLDLMAHCGAAARGLATDCGVLWFDATFMGASECLFSESTLNPLLSRIASGWTTVLSANWNPLSTARKWLVAYSVDVDHNDPLVGAHTRLLRGATVVLGQSDGGVHEGIGVCGGSSSTVGARQSVGLMRVITSQPAGVQVLQVDAASPSHALQGQQCDSRRVTVCAINLSLFTDQAYSWSDAVTGFEGTLATPGVQAALDMNPITPFGPESYVLGFGAALRHSTALSGQLGSYRQDATLFGRALGTGTNSLWVSARGPLASSDKKPMVPMVLFPPPEVLGATPTRAFRWRATANSNGSASVVKDASDVLMFAVQPNTAPVPTVINEEAGPELILVPQREGISISAMATLPVDPDLPLDTGRVYDSSSTPTGTGHRITWPRSVTGRRIFQFPWSALDEADFLTLQAFLESSPQQPFAYGLMGESAVAWIPDASTLQWAILAGSVYRVSVECVELVYVGPAERDP